MSKLIKERLFTIIDEIIPVSGFSTEEKFAIIGSNSIKATAFLAAIEDEFNTEIDDEFITARFFSDIDYVIECIEV